METIELAPAQADNATLSIHLVTARSALRIVRLIGARYPEAPYADVEAMANEVIGRAISLPTVPIIAHGFIVRYLWDNVTSLAAPVDVFA